MKATVGTKVEGYKSYCIGIVIDSVRYIGTITKVNKKSIRVKLEEQIIQHGRKEPQHMTACGEKNYRYWKTTSDGRELYRSENNLYGIIEL